jgi:hypothetical protein
MQKRKFRYNGVHCNNGVLYFYTLAHNARINQLITWSGRTFVMTPTYNSFSRFIVPTYFSSLYFASWLSASCHLVVMRGHPEFFSLIGIKIIMTNFVNGNDNLYRGFNWSYKKYQWWWLMIVSAGCNIIFNTKGPGRLLLLRRCRERERVNRR